MRTDKGNLIKKEREGRKDSETKERKENVRTKDRRR